MIKKSLFLGIYSIIVFLTALAFMICDFVMDINVLVHPILNFLLIVFGGFGLFNLVVGFIKKYPAYFFLSGILISLSALYVLLSAVDPWWIAIITFVVICIIFVCLSLVVCGNKTENIALNKSSEYKTYEERKEIKEEQDRIEREVEEENLPKIKTFKD